MHITEIETLLRGNIGVVRIHTDEGLVGIGQVAPYQAGISIQVLHQMVASRFLGQDPWDVEVLVDRCLRGHYKFTGSFLHRAVAGVDTALWDLLGRLTGQPVAKLLGGVARNRVEVYGSSMVRHTSPQQEVDRLLEAIQNNGFSGVKLRIGEVMGRDDAAAEARTRALVPLARERLGDEVAICADANGGYTAAEAIKVGRMLEDYGYFHFEEPCPFTDLEATRRVADALDIPVAGGEQDYLLPQFRQMIGTGAVDIIQPDVCYIGGISQIKKVAALAEASNVAFTPHCANDSLLQVFTLHVAAAIPGAFQRQEWSIEQTDWTQGIYRSPILEVREGMVELPGAPGWGIELEKTFITTAERAVSRL
ncbi:mandelate racemase/muconate lactonizing enzyme family protein [Nesterenkonia ebinurensis]|uniref:mandelate racemase/muconate lactonizing enzyme family protein n=1 Tax=Nesterenkonia ebinurensis TaxID=2608252 RepID=UPI00123CF259|nr:mandelate racemase/muconate lactonizing enzyme family protein [Nesterenkonia ebinurensis]